MIVATFSDVPPEAAPDRGVAGAIASWHVPTPGGGDLLVSWWSDEASLDAWIASRATVPGWFGEVGANPASAAAARRVVAADVASDLGFVADPFVRDALGGGDLVFAARFDRGGRVVVCNAALADLLGAAREEVVGRSLVEIVTEADARSLLAARDGDARQLLVNFIARGDTPVTLACLLRHDPAGTTLLGARPRAEDEALRDQLLGLNNALATIARENARRGRQLQRAKTRLEETVRDLNATYWHLKKIQEVLPICMECGRVKTAEAQWEHVVDYLRKNSLFLSHGYCPECYAAVRRSLGLPPVREEKP